MFRLFADLNQCRHIYFAGCHDTGFGSLLTPYRGRGDRITLIKAASFHRDFESLNLPIKELPSVFMSTPLTPPNPTVPKPVGLINTKVASAPTNGVKQPVCKHFQKVSLIYYQLLETIDLRSHPIGYLQIWQWVHQAAYHAGPTVVIFLGQNW